ncbi:MAG: Ldh family oxidoreductase [Thermomicrobiales bacterium]
MSEPLTDFATAVLASCDVPEHRARRAAEALVLSDLRGVQSHGVARLHLYVKALRSGLVDPKAELTVVRETPSTFAFDANGGFALALAAEAMDRTVERAETNGICMTTVRNSSHYGIAGGYVLQATKRGLAAISMTNAGPLVVPTGGAEPMFGTNPIAFGVPLGPDEPPFLLDLATSSVAYGKIEIARRLDKPLPRGVALDSSGEVTSDPHEAAFLTPLGADHSTGSHKGYSLAMMVDTLCGPLAGSLWGTHLTSVFRTHDRSKLGHFFLAWRVDAFRDPDEVADDLRQMLAELRATQTAPGVDQVLAPGDPEIAAHKRHEIEGITLDPVVTATLRGMAIETGIPFPG